MLGNIMIKMMIDSPIMVRVTKEENRFHSFCFSRSQVF